MDSEEKDDLEDDLSHDGLPEVEGAVHHHAPELDQHHDQEGPGDLVLGQRRGDVPRRVFLRGKQERQVFKPALGKISLPKITSAESKVPRRRRIQRR